jgi:hypothetical protein
MKLKKDEANAFFSVFLDVFSESLNMIDEGFEQPSSIRAITKFVKNNLKFTFTKDPKDWTGVKLTNNDDYLLNIITKNLATVLLKIFDAANYLNEVRIDARLPPVNIVQKAMELEVERRTTKNG